MLQRRKQLASVILNKKASDDLKVLQIVLTAQCLYLAKESILNEKKAY